MTSELTITVPDGIFKAYVAPAARADAPAVIVIQEIFGVNAGMRQVCDELAAQGFTAISPDLFWRTEPGLQMDDHNPDHWSKALGIYQAYDLDRGAADIAATVAAARTLPGTNGKVGVMGFCLGGLLTYLSAARGEADAFVAYYGGNTDKHLDRAAQVKRPLLMHLAGEDEFISREAQAAIRAALAGNTQVVIHGYAGRNHAFARPGGDHYDAEDAALANGRTADFFKAQLR